MKSSEKKILTLEIVSLIFLLLNLLLFKLDNIYIIFAFLLLLLIVLNFITGFEKNRKRFKKDDENYNKYIEMSESIYKNGELLKEAIERNNTKNKPL